MLHTATFFGSMEISYSPTSLGCLSPCRKCSVESLWYNLLSTPSIWIKTWLYQHLPFWLGKRRKFTLISKSVMNEIGISCIVLYCIVLYCIVLYCIVLYCIVLYCFIDVVVNFVVIRCWKHSCMYLVKPPSARRVWRSFAYNVENNTTQATDRDYDKHGTAVCRDW